MMLTKIIIHKAYYVFILTCYKCIVFEIIVEKT